jgi:hypothetical protein
MLTLEVPLSTPSGEVTPLWERIPPGRAYDPCGAIQLAAVNPAASDITKDLLLEILMQSRAALRAHELFGSSLEALFSVPPELKPEHQANEVAAGMYAMERLEEVFEALQSFAYSAAIVSSILFPSERPPHEFQPLVAASKCNAKLVKQRLSVEENSPLNVPSRDLRNEPTHLERSVIAHTQTHPGEFYAPLGVGQNRAEWLFKIPCFRLIKADGTVVSLRVGKATDSCVINLLSGPPSPVSHRTLGASPS